MVRQFGGDRPSSPRRPGAWRERPACAKLPADITSIPLLLQVVRPDSTLIGEVTFCAIASAHRGAAGISRCTQAGSSCATIPGR